MEDSECVSRKIKIFAHEHPEWKHDKVVAAAHGWCRKQSHADAIDLSTVISRSRSLSLSRFATLIKNIKTRIGLKVPHMGILPQKTSLPMKNLNRLQTKMEKVITAEQRWLTAEQYEQRRQYARYMRKGDSEYVDTEWRMSDDEFTDAIDELYVEILDHYKFLTPEEAIDRAFELPQGDKAWIMSNEAEIVSMNDGLNNIIKAPIILAKEMVQPYTNDKGEVEYHFKPYNELQKAVEDIKYHGSLDIIIEHQDWYEQENIIGSVKEFRADDSTRTIRGMGYFDVGKLPEGLLQMIRDGEIIAVSIGFLAQLGDGGEFNGIEYQHIQKNIHLRHLAVCLDSVARCPVGVCGVNLKDAQEPNKIKNFIIISKENYYYNICNMFNDSKKETNKETNINKKIEKIDTMQADSSKKTVKGDEPAIFEAILGRLRSLINDDDWEGELKQNRIAQILAALGIKGKSDSEMDDKEFKDAIAKKESELEEIRKELNDANSIITKFNEEKKANFITAIKKFGDKYSDEELEAEDLKSLEKIADAVSRFMPSKEKADVIPVAPKDDKKKLEDELEENKRIDFSNVFEDVNKEFNLIGL